MIQEKQLLFNGYKKIKSETIYKTKYVTGLKILIPEQMLQMLPIALAQVKAGNKSKSLLNEIEKLFIICISQKK